MPAASGFICHIKGQPSHEIVSNALLMLENMNHRGACGCEENSGDGAGILVRVPDPFLRAKCKDLGITLPKRGRLCRGRRFFAQGPGRAQAMRDDFRARRTANMAWSCSAGGMCR